jgi:hypothetical protein
MNSKIHCALTADIYHVDLANVNQWEEWLHCKKTRIVTFNITKS